MADLIAALANPAFGPVPVWVEVGKDGRPVDPQTVLKMPEQTEIYCPIDKKHHLQASVSQCNAESLEHFQAFTDDQWKKQVVRRLPDDLKKDGKLFSRSATAAWKRVLKDNQVDKNNESTLTFDKFQECRVCYLLQQAHGYEVPRRLRHPLASPLEETSVDAARGLPPVSIDRAGLSPHWSALLNVVDPEHIRPCGSRVSWQVRREA